MLNTKLSCMQGIAFTLVKGKVLLYEYCRNSNDDNCFWTLLYLLIWGVLDTPEFSSSLNHQESQERKGMQPLCSKGKAKQRVYLDAVLKPNKLISSGAATSSWAWLSGQGEKDSNKFRTEKETGCCRLADFALRGLKDIVDEIADRRCVRERRKCR